MITGAKGMLGRSLMRRWSDRHELVACDRSILDIGDARACERVIAAVAPAVVIHCAAFTAVDRCASDPDAAYRANAIGSGNIAAACHRQGCRLIAVSTDYVFAGDLDRPYHEWDATGPRTVYGQSKLAGENAVRSLCPAHCIVRVAWLYGEGGPSFLHTLLKLGAQQGPDLKVVDDQLGNPTSTEAVVDGLERLLDADILGTVHMTCEGETSWYGFARAIFALKHLTRPIKPCISSEFPRPAPRPANSRLEKRQLRLQGLPPMIAWQEELERFLHHHPVP